MVGNQQPSPRRPDATLKGVSDVRVIDHHDRCVAESVRNVQRASYAVEAGLIGYDRMPGLIEDADDVRRLPLTMLGAIVDAQLVGVLGYRRSGETVDIDRLVVLPSHFRRGFARHLLVDLHHREADAACFQVSTAAANAPAVALYEAMGYRQENAEVVESVQLVHFVRR